MVLGTNKGAALWGTGVAFWRYTRAVPLPWRSVALAAAAAAVASAGGALLARQIDTAAFKPVVVVVLVAVALFTWFRPEFGALARGRERPWLGAALGAAIGFYDGVVGPGTGTFLVFAFIAALGLDFLGASAAAKGVNLATNVAAVTMFALAGEVRWAWSLPMAVANMAGGYVGARLALSRGSAWVRRVFQVVVLALVARVAWDVASTLGG
jgi:uncharacterized membrane protein YfcA